MGASAGSSLGAAISKWLGSGDYAVSSNTLVNKVRSSDSVPLMHNTNQSVIVRHKEYLGQVYSSSGFTVQNSFPLNPGNSTTLPWLSQIAARFQEYAFKGVVFHFVPTSGSISSTQALGSVMMQTTYRTTEAPPQSKVELLNEFWASEGVPFDTFCHPIECDPKENPFNVHYVRGGPVPAGESPMAYDLGTMHLATAGQAVSDIALGDLFVTYEVELKKPLLISDVATLGSYYRGTYTPASYANLFATRVATSGTLAVTTGASNTLILPKGSRGLFFITVILSSNGAVSGALSWTGDPPFLQNCVLAPYHNGLSTNAIGTVAASSTGVYQIWYGVAVYKSSPDVTASVVIPTATVTGSAPTAFVIVCNESDARIGA
jgi:hypothetical protein